MFPMDFQGAASTSNSVIYISSGPAAESSTVSTPSTETGHEDFRTGLERCGKPRPTLVPGPVVKRSYFNIGGGFSRLPETVGLEITTQ